MNNEIKEILQTLEDSIFCKFDLHTGEKKKILDYITNLQNQLEEKNYLYNKLDTESKYVITNLQEENQELRADYGNKAQVERDLLEDRINKAIEYIEEEINDKSWVDDNFNEVYGKDLLEILKGENNE